MKKLSELSHVEKFEAIVNIIGVEKVIRFSPINIELAREELKKGNEHLNFIVPLKKWDNKSIMLVGDISRAVKIIDATYNGGISQAECNCAVKIALKMYIEGRF